MQKSIHILIAEDSATDAELARRAIHKVLKNCEFVVEETRADFLTALETFQPDVILSDYTLPSFDGMKALKLARKHAPLTPLIIWSGSISEDIAVDCMKAGANNYVLKENLKRLGPAVLHALEERELLVARKQAEDKYQAIFENSVDGIFQSTPDGRYLHVNSAMAHIYGYDSPQEMIESVTDIASQIYMEPQERVHFRQLLETQSTIENYEQRNCRKDGSLIWTSTSVRAVRDANGDILYYEGFTRNITERKLMEERLKESETKYRTLVEHLPAITYTSEPDQYIGVSYISPQIESLGFSSAAWLADPEFWLRQIHEEDRERVLSELREFQGGDEPFRTEYRLILPNGETKWFHDESIRVRDQNGKPILKQGFMLDITERKQAEDTLRDREQELRSITEDMTELICRFLPDGTLTYVNNVYCRYYGKSREELIGTNFITTAPVDLPQKHSDYFKSFSLEHPIDTFEQYDVLPNGEKRYREWVDRGIFDEWGHLIEIQSTGRDITARKQAEEALRESENRYRTLVEAQTEFIVRWKSDGMRTFANKSYCNYFGLTPEEAISNSFIPLVYEQDRPNVEKKIQRLLSGEASVETEIHRVIRPDGKIGWQEWTDQAIHDKDGQLVEFQSVGRDITARKQAEIERQALLEIMQGLAATKDLQELLKLVHCSIGQVIYAENFFVTLYRPNSSMFEEIYFVDQYDDSPTPPDKLEKSITSYIFRSGEPLLLTPVLFEELTTKGEIELIGTNFKSWLGVPLKTSGRTIGVIAVQDYENENRYSERDRDFLASIATQIALVIERKRAEEALYESEEHYRTIFEGVQDAIFVESVDGKILMVNERACEMFGYSRAEFLTKTVSDIVPEGHLILTADGMDSPLSSKPRETVNRRSNGEIFPIEVSGGIQVINGETVLLVVVRDITERKRAEVAEREQRVLAEALRDTAETLNGTLNYGEVLDHILAAVGRVVPHDAGTIMLIEGEWAQVVRSQGYDKHGFNPEIMGIKLPVAETTNLRQMLETRQPVVVYDTHTYVGWKRLSTTDWLRSSVGAPISI